MFSMFNHSDFQRQLHFVAAFSLLMLSTVQDFILYRFRAPRDAVGCEELSEEKGSRGAWAGGCGGSSGTL